MQFAACHIQCHFLEPARLPPFAGTVFRNALGRQFKRLACLHNKGRCDTCRAAPLCDYAKYFEMPSEVRKVRGKKTSSWPRPFVLETPDTGATLPDAGVPGTFRLLIFGPAVSSAPVFIRAVEAMGEDPGRSGVKFKLNKVICDNRVVYEPQQSPDVIMPSPEEIGMPLMEEAAAQDDLLLVELLTPLKIKQGGQTRPILSFQTMTRLMLRRISSLLDCYGEGAPRIDYKRLIEQAKNIRSPADELSWYDWRHHDSRRDQSLLKGSIIGTVTFQGAIKPYLPLVDLCRQLHLGRQTECGLGKFQVG